MQLIRQSHAGNLLHNETTGFFEVWNDGNRVFEILTDCEETAKKTFESLVGEVWEGVNYD